MLCGLPAVSFFSAQMSEPIHLFWRQSHVILVPTAIWTIAIGAALPHLELSERRESILVWAMIISGYFFVISIPIQGAALYLNQDIVKGPLGPYYIGALAVNGFTALLAASLVAIGAFAVLQKDKMSRHF